MSRYEKKIDGGVHSRLKNDLLENQRWWPITIKHDGADGYLTLDPILYASEIQTHDELVLASGQEHAYESQYPGIRIEYLKTNAAKSEVVSGEGTCTITISNSGTWGAQAVLSWPDGTTTTIPFVSESLAGKHFSTNRYEAFEQMDTATKTVGPAPVPLTIQELADLLDTFTKTDGAYSGETPSGRSFNPHPNDHIYLPDEGYNVLPTYNTIATLSNWLGTEADAQLAATVFMPMVANMNQYSRNMSAVTGLTVHAFQNAPDGSPPSATEVIPLTDGKDMDRFNPDPEGDDSASVTYGFANQFGDHKFGHRRFGSAQHHTLAHVNSADSGLSPNPKWRHRMCLAMFLKDGTYTISAGGALIPYIFDPRREIGGEQYKRNRGQHAKDSLYLGGPGLYGNWNPNGRSGETIPGSRYASAMISPGVDFIQGPFSSASHGWNYNVTDYIGVYGKLFEGGITWSNYDRTYLETFHNLNSLPVPVYAIEMDGGTNTLDVYIDEDEYFNADPLVAGQAIYLTGIDGALGWGTSFDCNGWWIIQSTLVGVDASAPSGDALRVRLVCGYSTTVAKYTLTSAHLRMGRPKPELVASSSKIPEDSGHWYNGGNTPGNRSYTPSLYGTVNDLLPGIEDHAATVSNVRGYNENNKYSVYQNRQIHLSGSKTDYPTETSDADYPTPTLTGGVGIRIPPQLGDQGHLGENIPSGTQANIQRSQWMTKGILMSLWSAVDQETGRHSWDYIRPTDSAGNQWIKGRNRAWPGRLRANTGLAVQPSLWDLRNSASDATLDTYNSNPLFGIPTDKYGLTEWGVSPVYADIELSAYIPLEKDRCTKIWFERGGTSPIGIGDRRGFVHIGASQYDQAATYGGQSRGWGHYPLNDESFQQTIGGKNRRFYANTFTSNDAWWWAWGGSDILEDPDVKTALLSAGASQPYEGSRTGWGNATNHIGSGGSKTTFIEGIHKLRFAFFKDRMIHYRNDVDEGSDSSSQGPVFGFTFEHGAFHTSDTSITNGVWENNLNKTGKDPVIDSVKVREIPTPQMLPFVAETITYSIANVAKYRELFVVGSNITTTQTIRISICAPGATSGSWDGFGQEPGTPYTGFHNLDPEWVGGYGSVSLLELPAAALTNGFTVRYEWNTATAEDGDDGVFDWDKMPSISEWTIDYDLKPTATLAVTGETYNGDISSPISTRVGHIVSYRIAGTTLDEERLLTHVKFDYGDGIITDWLPISDQGMTATYDINHSYVSTASGLSARAKVRDNNLNESDWTSTITINVANAPPVAVLRAVPSMVRAGDSVKLDAGRSYDIEEGGVVNNFNFTPGDGSSIIGPQSTTYANHTYAIAGEYLATVTCQDASAATSNTASAVIKVLPARLTVPLVLNTMPNSFMRNLNANYNVTEVLDSDYPEVSDSGSRSDEFTLRGMFLTGTAELDIDFMEDLLATGHLVEFEWMSVNFVGTPDSRTFIGRIVSFTYNREGSAVGQTPWTATLIRESGVGE